MEFELLTLSGTKFSGTIKMVSLTTAEGQIGILPHHEPLVAKVVGGPVTVTPVKGEPEVFATYGGLLEVTAQNRARILADEADLADELVMADVESALKRAQDLRAAAKDKTELAHAQEMVDRQAVRLGVAKMRRHHERHR